MISRIKVYDEGNKLGHKTEFRVPELSKDTSKALPEALAIVGLLAGDPGASAWLEGLQRQAADKGTVGGQEVAKAIGNMRLIAESHSVTLRGFLAHAIKHSAQVYLDAKFGVKRSAGKDTEEDILVEG